ncbi:TPA: CBS domain-containing protein [Vibrio vulnificus]|uniref:Nucleotidyltransferase family protein n=1 Tax=Vibrio vulnificus TaxID=672 RepID=A0AAW4HIJ4_VIBVL|nr:MULTISPECIES: nucleotidyltransferase family protein [Vibrio]EGQ7930511.1 CBS domain-containing protein [Vibrio vulnificus]EGQ8022964.1 CBS domain-containing protein [Vibrio vulnificus]EGQ9280622.1 CBS domain-containing protein [Vibrio vulnificus]EGQ9970098.1 CBS domain-containing protein [Vibrio vulnificus]EGR0209024.1 CBS domain-containing protein [Vibrio vulnificus]
MSHNWKKILVSPAASIRSVLRTIDQQALKLALVVDEQNKLLGTVSDGDIRRAILRDASLEDSVDLVMNTQPTTADVSMSRDNILSLMERKELHAIPILSNGVVIGLETLHGLLHKPEYANPVFLMAGGFGTRLKPLTDNCPKPLLKVGERPILETVILSFIRAGFSNFYISTHYLPEMIHEALGDGSRWGVSIQYIHEETPLGTGGALGLLPDSLPDLPVIVMNGDILTKINFEDVLEFHNKNDSKATMCVREFEYQVPFGVIEAQDFKITGIVEKPTYRFHVNAGIYVLNKSLIASVAKGEYLDMPTLFEQQIGRDIHVFPFHEYWLDIGRMDDYKRAQVDILTLGL